MIGDKFAQQFQSSEPCGGRLVTPRNCYQASFFNHQNVNFHPVGCLLKILLTEQLYASAFVEPSYAGDAES
jgi:hypothetical protein